MKQGPTQSATIVMQESNSCSRGGWDLEQRIRRHLDGAMTVMLSCRQGPAMKPDDRAVRGEGHDPSPAKLRHTHIEPKCPENAWPPQKSDADATNLLRWAILCELCDIMRLHWLRGLATAEAYPSRGVCCRRILLINPERAL
jgi:hypothetical protein